MIQACKSVLWQQSHRLPADLVAYTHWILRGKSGATGQYQADQKSHKHAENNKSTQSNMSLFFHFESTCLKYVEIYNYTFLKYTFAESIKALPKTINNSIYTFKLL